MKAPKCKTTNFLALLKNCITLRKSKLIYWTWSTHHNYGYDEYHDFFYQVFFKALLPLAYSRDISRHFVHRVKSLIPLASFRRDQGSVLATLLLSLVNLRMIWKLLITFFLLSNPPSSHFFQIRKIFRVLNRRKEFHYEL